MIPKQNNASSAYRRVMKKQQDAALQHALAGFDPEYLSKLRHDCLVAANARLRGASADEIVRDAQKDFEGRIRFLTEAK